jgi:predicted adenine nucleotide alpha hydrolase (AANH) superfamily ATPase
MAHKIEPVIFYFNPNIYPQEEYEIRKNESKRHAASLGIEWIDADRFRTGASQPCGYGHEEWRQAVCGLEHEPERGKRCEACFYHRLVVTARKAQELGIPFFATTLASSRWKNLDQINRAGEMAAQTVGNAVHFWPQNWRKDGLQERRNQLLKEYDFYNQTYCGCEFSMRTGSDSFRKQSPNS